MRARYWLGAGFLVSAAALGSAATPCPPFDHGHAAWSRLLARYVSNGSVDYSGLKSRGQGELAAYERSLGAVCRADFDHWTREEKVAFWINSYNVFTVQLVLDHYPIDSIRSVGLLPGAAFRTSFISLPGLRDGKLSLDEIENGILRRDFAEPRIHFAIVCASKGCPPLRADAYRAADLNKQLDEATRTYIRDPAHNRFDGASRTLYLSSIFKWFREDFERAAGSLPSFVARYAGDNVAAAIRSGDVRIEFLDYDWSLNRR